MKKPYMAGHGYLLCNHVLLACPLSLSTADIHERTDGKCTDELFSHDLKYFIPNRDLCPNVIPVGYGDITNHITIDGNNF